MTPFHFTGTSILTGQPDDSKLLLRKTRKLIFYFQFTKFGATKIWDLISKEPITTRCQNDYIEQVEKRAILGLLQSLVEIRNRLILLFKKGSPKLIIDNYQTLNPWIFSRGKVVFRKYYMSDLPESLKRLLICSHQDSE
jgi:hypothetical protein